MKGKLTLNKLDGLMEWSFTMTTQDDGDTVNIGLLFIEFKY